MHLGCRASIQPSAEAALRPKVAAKDCKSFGQGVDPIIYAFCIRLDFRNAVTGSHVGGGRIRYFRAPLL